MTPLRAGPMALFAFSPIWWQALHTTKTFSPAAASCALASPAPIADTGPGGLGSLVNAGAIPIALTGFRNSGGMVGGTAGYNWQVNPNWVVGIEGDIDWVSAKRTFNTGFITVPGFVPVETAYNRELDWLGTLR